MGFHAICHYDPNEVRRKFLSFTQITLLFSFFLLPSAVSSDASASLPVGTIAFYYSSCPSGWQRFVLADGRYLVILPSNGESGAQVGAALANLELRVTGAHTHIVGDSGHSHSTSGVAVSITNHDGDEEHEASDAVTAQIYAANTGISIAYSSGPQDTNAPYVNVIICEKIEESSKIPEGMTLYNSYGYCMEEDGWDYFVHSGRMVVGAVTSFNETVGTPLGDGEVRETGKHTHQVIDHSHAHYTNAIQGTGPTARHHGSSNTPIALVGAGGIVYSAATNIHLSSPVEVTFAGTNVPYIQLGTCTARKVAEIPRGTLAFFNLPACPSGWFDVPDEWRGRYVTTVFPGGTSQLTVGVQLEDKENRVTIAHNHDVIDPHHSHSSNIGVLQEWHHTNNYDDHHTCAQVITTPTISISQSNIEITKGIDSSGRLLVEGTNGPFVQVLACVYQVQEQTDIPTFKVLFEGWIGITMSVAGFVIFDLFYVVLYRHLNSEVPPYEGIQ